MALFGNSACNFETGDIWIREEFWVLVYASMKAQSFWKYVPLYCSLIYTFCASLNMDIQLLRSRSWGEWSCCLQVWLPEGKESGVIYLTRNNRSFAIQLAFPLLAWMGASSAHTLSCCTPTCSLHCLWHWWCLQQQSERFPDSSNLQRVNLQMCTVLTWLGLWTCKSLERIFRFMQLT